MPVSFTLRNFILIQCLFIMAISAASGASMDTAGWQQGRSEFKSYCASCHHPAMAQTGPALTGVTARWEAGGEYHGKTGKQWLYAWIRNWKDPVDSGYPYAVKIQNYSPSQMNVFTALTDSEITDILAYVEYPNAITPAAEHKPDRDTGWSDVILYVLISLIAISLVVLFMVSRRNRAL